ncbi:uncharacterized protein C1orf105 homolog [Acomys russatus]|uniref:uncharacterized protein C1orf105 homolog n=1 Tax=Acomys russatus TaxID=60746 RepID=UPI0021E21E18|nr:uncharacterized protein C1orf105 homolog [Acomys russatus]
MTTPDTLESALTHWERSDSPNKVADRLGLPLTQPALPALPALPARCRPSPTLGSAGTAQREGLRNPPAPRSYGVHEREEQPPTYFYIRDAGLEGTTAEEHFRVCTAPPPKRPAPKLHTAWSLLPSTGCSSPGDLLQVDRSEPGKQIFQSFTGHGRLEKDSGAMEECLSFSLQAFVPKFEKVPWISETSLVNKPLVLSIPGRYHYSATVLTSYKKDIDLPSLLQVPDVILKARTSKHESLSPGNKHLCSMCQECPTVKVKTAQPKSVMIPRLQTPSSQNSVHHREMNLQHLDVQQVNHSRNDIPTESICYRLPIMGPRTAVFHRLLSGAYKTPQEKQHLPFPRKKGMSKIMKP